MQYNLDAIVPIPDKLLNVYEAICQREGVWSVTWFIELVHCIDSVWKDSDVNLSAVEGVLFALNQAGSGVVISEERWICSDLVDEESKFYVVHVSVFT